MFKSELKKEDVDKVLKHYISIVKNETERHFERYSITPFTKWYVKYYSINAEIEKIIKAFETGILDELHDNLKSKTKKILKIIEIK